MLPWTTWDSVGLASLGREHCRYPGGISGSPHRDDVNGDTKANVTLSRTTSTLMLARSTIEESVKNEENLSPPEQSTTRTARDLHRP
jgi:hypothetical protein